MSAEILSTDFESFVVPAKEIAVDDRLINSTTLVTPHGEIYYKEQALRKDLYILEGQYSIENDMSISGEGENNLLEIQFNLSDQDIVFHDKHKTEKVAPAGSGNIVFLPAEENKAKIFFKKDVTYNTFDIHLPVDLLDHYGGESELMDNFLNNIQNNRTGALAPQTIPVNPAIYNAIQDIRNCRFQGLTRKIYLESKTYELIALINENAENQKTDYNLNKSDQERIHQAAAIIRNNLERPCSIIDLARMVGVNQTKLKSGFKSIFSNTVFGYLQEVRMYQAKRHLLDTELSVQEISMLLGYQNTSNFSSAFKKIHGYSPMKMRQGQGEV